MAAPSPSEQIAEKLGRASAKSLPAVAAADSAGEDTPPPLLTGGAAEAAAAAAKMGVPETPAVPLAIFNNYVASAHTMTQARSNAEFAANLVSRDPDFEARHKAFSARLNDFYRTAHGHEILAEIAESVLKFRTGKLPAGFPRDLELQAYVKVVKEKSAAFLVVARFAKAVRHLYSEEVCDEIVRQNAEAVALHRRKWEAALEELVLAEQALRAKKSQSHDKQPEQAPKRAAEISATRAQAQAQVRATAEKVAAARAHARAQATARGKATAVIGPAPHKRAKTSPTTAPSKAAGATRAILLECDQQTQTDPFVALARPPRIALTVYHGAVVQRRSIPAPDDENHPLYQLMREQHAAPLSLMSIAVVPFGLRVETIGRMPETHARWIRALLDVGALRAVADGPLVLDHDVAVVSKPLETYIGMPIHVSLNVPFMPAALMSASAAPATSS